MNSNLRNRKNSLFWIGITAQTLVTLFNINSYADRNDHIPPNQNALANPNANSGTQGFDNFGNSPFFDDEEDDEDDDFSRFPGRPGTRPNNSGSASNARSGGGQPKSDGPEPVRTSNGISIGGQTPNGVISKNNVSPMQIDSETAEGSKELVTDFNFPDADILDLAKALGKLTGKNFVLDKEVKGKVSIITNSPITVSQAWKLFLTALDVNGFALVPSGAYLRIAKQRDARDKQLKTYTGDFSPDTDALITRVFALKYISSEEVVRTFRSILPATSRVIGYDQTNTVIVTDTGSNISRLAKLLEILDVEGFDAGIEVVPVKYASAAELSKLIDALIPGTGAGSASAGSVPGMPRMGGRFSARRTKEGGIINTIIADERTNTLIVHANTKGADQVRELVAKLDLKVPTSMGGGKVRVVYLQFADSEQVANTLNNFSTQAKPAAAAGGGGGGGTGSNPISGSLFEGSIKISPDKATNSLVITASPSDFVTVQRVINQLDIPREQVYVEVVLMEVALERGFKFSSNLAAPNSFLGSTPGGGADLGFLANGPLGILGNVGALATIPLGAMTAFTSTSGQPLPAIPSAFAMIKASQNNQNVSVLATPQIIALDNTEATFESSEKIPMPTANAVQGAGTQLSYGNTTSITTSIKIKPQINKIINFVKMEVTVKLGDIDNSHVPTNVIGNAIGTTERTSQTTVLVGDADTVVLGGLMRDKASDQITKIPLLGDIPIIGWLFKSKATSVEKRNLLIFLTPHIVRQYEKVRTILDRKLKERDEFIESTAGGVDPLRYQRDAMIRSLPDLKELTEKHPPTTITIDDDRLPVAPSGTPLPPPAIIIPPSEPSTPSTAPTPSSATTPPTSLVPAVAVPVIPPMAPAASLITPSTAPLTAPPTAPAAAAATSEVVIPPTVSAPTPSDKSLESQSSRNGQNEMSPTPSVPMQPVHAQPPGAPAGGL